MVGCAVFFYFNFFFVCLLVFLKALKGFLTVISLKEVEGKEQLFQSHK